MIKLEAPCKIERAIATALREACVTAISKISIDQAASSLGLIDLGVEVLCYRPSWSIDTALRVASALGVDVFYVISCCRRDL